MPRMIELLDFNFKNTDFVPNSHSELKMCLPDIFVGIIKNGKVKLMIENLRKLCSGSHQTGVQYG